MELITIIQSLNKLLFELTLIFIFLDIITGYLQAAANKCLSSNIMRQGFWHKLAFIFAILLAGLVDITANAGVNLGFSMPLFECACGYTILMEITSILENIKKMNPQLADSKLLKLLDTKKNGGEDDESE